MTTIAPTSLTSGVQASATVPSRRHLFAHSQPILLLLTGSVLAIAALEFSARTTHSAVTDTLSSLFYASGGQVLFPLGASLLTAALAGWFTQLLHRGFYGPAILAAIASIGLLAAALFPTDPAGSIELSTHAQIHRFGAAAMFLAVPLIGLLLMRTKRIRTPAHRVLRVSIATSAIAAIPAITSRLTPIMPAGQIQNIFHDFAALSGFVERIQLLLVVMIMVTSLQICATRRP